MVLTFGGGSILLWQGAYEAYEGLVPREGYTQKLAKPKLLRQFPKLRGTQVWGVPTINITVLGDLSLGPHVSRTAIKEFGPLSCMGLVFIRGTYMPSFSPYPL